MRNSMLADAGARPQSLLERLHDRSDAAWEELVRRHGGALLALARRYFAQESEAAAALQQAFAGAYRDVVEVDEEGALAGWLQRRVVDACLARLAAAPLPTGEIEPWLPAFDRSGQRRVTPGGPRADLAFVRRSIARLPAPYRAVLLLSASEGLDADAIAERLGLPRAEVVVRLHRARQALLTLLGPGLSASA